MKVVSFDPGFTGGIACIEDDKVVTASRMPIISVPVTIKGKKKTRSELDMTAIAAIIRDFDPDIVVIERVSSRPGEGSTSSFRFGFGTGALHGIAIGCGYETEVVSPVTWKKHFKLSSSKDDSLEMARTLYPDISDTVLKYKKDNGVAEAILIGLWKIQKTIDE